MEKDHIDQMLESILNSLPQDAGVVLKKQRKPRKELTTIELNIKDLWKGATAALFEGLQTNDYPVSNEKLLSLLMPFGGASKMREAFKNPTLVAIMVGLDRYEQIKELVNHQDPFVIVVRKGNAVYATINPIEDQH